MIRDIEEDHDDSEECDDAVSDDGISESENEEDHITCENDDNFEDRDITTTAYGIPVSDNEQDRIVLENDDEFNEIIMVS